MMSLKLNHQTELQKDQALCHETGSRPAEAFVDLRHRSDTDRMASIMLLPLYTHCLTPADYGVTAILDLTTAILALMIGGGMVSAVTRFHFDQDDELHHDRVWWTGFACMAVLHCSCCCRSGSVGSCCPI